MSVGTSGLLHLVAQARLSPKEEESTKALRIRHRHHFSLLTRPQFRKHSELSSQQKEEQNDNDKRGRHQIIIAIKAVGKKRSKEKDDKHRWSPTNITNDKIRPTMSQDSLQTGGPPRRLDLVGTSTQMSCLADNPADKCIVASAQAYQHGMPHNTLFCGHSAWDSSTAHVLKEWQLELLPYALYCKCFRSEPLPSWIRREQMPAISNSNR